MNKSHKNQKKQSAISLDQAKDSSMALVLICLILWFYFKTDFWVICAASVLVAAMALPQIFKPFAWAWFGLAHILGAISSRIILSLCYFLVVAPIGLLRRILGKDSLQINKFKQGTESVFITRNHRFQADDLKNPY